MSARTATLKSGEQAVEIKLAHSPDSDDAFMFYALATHKLPTPGYKYTHVLSDIQTLNEAALTETYDVTAVSFAAYPSVRDKYILIDCGASFGEGYGPIVVAAKSLKKEDIKGKRMPSPASRLPPTFRSNSTNRILKPWSCLSTKSSTPCRMSSSRPGCSFMKAS